VFVVYDGENLYFDGQGEVSSVDLLPKRSDDNFWNDTLWCLFDCKGKTYSDLHMLPFQKCTIVLSTSPRREMINDFKKPPVPRYFFMPTWTEAELAVIAPAFSDSNEWRDRFKSLGGIPRFVLESTELNPTEMLEAACKDFSG